MPARLHVASAGQQRIPLFWTFAASPNNTDPITISITYSQEVECPIENYVGTLCEYFVPHIDNSFTYSAKFSESGNIAPVLDIQDQTSFVYAFFFSFNWFNHKTNNRLSSQKVWSWCDYGHCLRPPPLWQHPHAYQF